MIQILGLRDYFNKKSNRLAKREEFFNKGWRATDVPSLFKHLDHHLSKIPEKEQYNLYYTAAQCLEEKGRVLESQSIIPFDIDDIEIDKLQDYIAPVLSVLKLSREQVGIVATGNGLQFIVGISEPILSDDYFEEYRPYYKALCGAITQALYEHGLPGNVDPVVFSPARLLRLPGTKNIKPNKGEKQAVLLQGNIDIVDFDLVEISGIPVVEYSEQVSDEMLKRLPPPDTKGVLNGCDFIKWCKDNPAEVSEPQWYALLSILGRLEGGRDVAHSYSRGHPDYSEYETDRKITQAIETAGPRTCTNISNMWDGCVSCKNWQKCKSPIVIQSEEYIKTKDTGFYNIELDSAGIPKKGKPNYDDMMRYFKKNHPFVTMADGKITFTWDGKHWSDYAPQKIDAFAEQNFDPSPNNQMCNEFRGKIQRNNIREPHWFQPEHLINFSNGYLDLKSMELRDHSQKIGFRYVLPFDFDPGQDCPRFKQFLGEVTRGDESLQRVLLEFMGYSLSGISPALGQKALVLVGNGSNGKSVFMDVLKYLAGQGNYSTLSMGHEINKLENRYQLDGKLFNISEETPNNAMMDSTVFKALVSGGEVQARKLYCDAYSMRNKAKIIMACNKLPSTNDLSFGMFRRLLIVPFNVKFTKDTPGYDPNLLEKLCEEASGIFNMALAALLRFQRNSMFSDSDTIDREVAKYKLDNDEVQQWWNDSVENVADDKYSTVPGLYYSYKVWVQEQMIKPRTLSWFSRKLRDIVNDDSRFKRQRVDGKLTSTVYGYKIQEAGF